MPTWQAEAEEQGWTVKVYLVEVGCRGFVASSTIKLLKELGIRGQVQRRIVRELVTVGWTQCGLPNHHVTR